MSGSVRPSHIDQAARIIDREYGPCNDTVNHDGRQALWAAEALNEAGLLVAPKDSAA